MIAVIIQARMNSSRMPGKTMQEIAGKPLLYYCVHRCQQAKSVDAVIVATTTSLKDDIIADWCHKNEINCYRGNEDDVLDRYYQTAKKIGVDIIVRVTSDCPFADPIVIDTLVRDLKDSGADYVSNRIRKRTYPHGIDAEVLQFSALEAAWKNATEKGEREHVTPYVMKHPNIFSVRERSLEEDLSNYRLTVDYPEDFELTRVLIEEYRADDLPWRDIIEIVRENPHIAEINRIRKDIVI
ncbi:glycosyltransferase family protein [Methanocalculus sp.]|uniref:glycosyltransferase family protein n=1 Tax=Methanocalculus sp. TaxID=2004547 RepID=UPI0026332722|nr:glycosyltransferase family protein [Methanocalculus sp.]MDG6249245.1 glycosyltransferase family protein [Methanocalculus sp.]